MQRPLFIADHTERLLCPLPLKADLYRGCSGACAYCSLNGLRTGIKGGGEVSANSVKYIEKFFYHAKASMEKALIDQRCPIQVGVSADPLQPIEKRQRVMLRVLKIMQDREYPIVITSKFPNQLTEPEYLRVLDGLPCVVQCSISSADGGLLRRLEPGAPSLSERLDALRTLHDAGVNIQLRLWPFAPDLCGDVAGLLTRARGAGVRTVQCNFLKLYHSGGCKERINAALGYDYEKETAITLENHGVFQISPPAAQRREISYLEELCTHLGLDLLTCDDLTGSRNWRDCCGLCDLPGFKPSPWAYYMRGHVITKHTNFDEYMHGLDCPFHEEFKEEWEKGKLARVLPELEFHHEDKTYSRQSKS